MCIEIYEFVWELCKRVWGSFLTVAVQSICRLDVGDCLYTVRLKYID